ncbi:unnamed protein product [Adineta steineri]|uniref:Uncharacterized protein n=1 Tax=Adineta steineri TaxID=433720 RepID=A0A813TTK8_9BILA|nr:unnamed protein product [Adineta steineri]CAF4127502.1 unnamed protein product [Adineta steineri]
MTKLFFRNEQTKSKVGKAKKIIRIQKQQQHENILISTISDSFSLSIGLVTRLLTGFNVDPTQYLSGFRKMRFFVTYYSAYSGAWFISLACVEQYLSGFLAFDEQIYCIDINQQLLGAPQSCYQFRRNIACQIADSLLQFLLEILTPAIVMIMFGSLVLRNFPRKHSRIDPIKQTNTFASTMAVPPVNSLNAEQKLPPVNIKNASNNQ